MFDSASLTHSTCRQNHLRSFICIDCLRSITGHCWDQSADTDWVDSTPNVTQCLFIKTTFLISHKYFCCLNRKRTVHVNRKILILREQVLVFDLLEIVQQFLCTPHRKRRNNHTAATRKCIPQDLYQTWNIPFRFFMQPVSISGFHHHIIGIFRRLRITNQWLIEISDVSGKYDFFRHAIFRQPKLNAGGTKKMTSIQEANLNTWNKGKLFIIRMRYKQL